MNYESVTQFASRTTYAGASLSAGSAAATMAIPPSVQETVLGLTLTQWSVLGILFGMAMGLAGWVVNWWYRRAHFNLAKRNQAEFYDE
jgi:TRAP-type C4-dicarboxylate transport system permease large subunit